MNIYFLNKNLEWQRLDNDIENDINVIYPQNFTFGNDETLDCAELSFYSNSDYFIPIDTIIRITNYNHFSYWIVKDSKASNLKHLNLKTKKMQNINTLTLVEPLEILRGFKVAPCSFAENSYTLEQIIHRIFDISKFYGECVVPNVKYYNPKLTFVSSNLFLIAHELARTIDCLPYLYFNETTKKWILGFQELDLLNKKVYDISVLNNPIILKTDTGEGIAKNVYCEVKNIRIDNTIRFPMSNYIKGTPTDDSYKLTLENFGAKINNDILDIDEIDILGAGFGQESDNLWILKDNSTIGFYVWNGTVTAIPSQHYKTKLIRIMPKKDFDLYVENKDDIETIYIYYENNIVFLNQLIKVFDYEFGKYDTNDYVYLRSSLTTDSNPDISTMKGVLNATNNDVFVNAKLENRTISINYYPLITRSIPFQASNNSNYDDTTYFNQNAQQVDHDRIGRSLQTYIDNMSSGSLIKSGTFHSWNSIPMPGSIIKDENKKYLINSISITNNKGYSEATVQLTEFHSKRRDYIEANTNLQLNTIPNENIIDKLSNEVIHINFSTDSTDIKEFGNIRVNEFVKFNNDINKINFYNNFIAKEQIYNLEGQTLVFRMSNNIIFSEKSYSNVIWDIQVDGNGNAIPKNYTDEKGFIEVASLSLKKEDNGDPFYVNAIYESPVKDPYEVFTFTLQLNYRGVNEVIVREEYVENLLNPQENTGYTIRLFNKQIGKYDLIPDEEDESFVAKIENVNIDEYDEETSAIAVSFSGLSNIKYKSFVIMLNDETPLFIKNFDEEQTSISSFNLYVGIENGTPIRTGVYGIDPKERR